MVAQIGIWTRESTCPMWNYMHAYSGWSSKRTSPCYWWSCKLASVSSYAIFLVCSYVNNTFIHSAWCKFIFCRISNWTIFAFHVWPFRLPWLWALILSLGAYLQVDSNELLYYEDPSYQEELAEITANVVEMVVMSLDHASDKVTLGTWIPTSLRSYQHSPLIRRQEKTTKSWDIHMEIVAVICHRSWKSRDLRCHIFQLLPGSWRGCFTGAGTRGLSIPWCMQCPCHSLRGKFHETNLMAIGDSNGVDWIES